MNPIEQLGGYEKAKNIRLGNEEDWMFYSIKKDWYSDIKHDESFIFIDDLKYQLLEHRRANNIFEMGDYIIHEDELMVFAMWSKKVSNCAYIGYAYAEDGFLVKNDEFRHATPEEIKAGKRSEVAI